MGYCLSAPFSTLLDLSGFFNLLTIFSSCKTSLDCYYLSSMLLSFQNKTPLGKTSFGSLDGNQKVKTYCY